MNNIRVGCSVLIKANAKFYSKEEIKDLDKLGKLSSITKQVLSDNNWL